MIHFSFDHPLLFKKSEIEIILNILSRLGYIFTITWVQLSASGVEPIDYLFCLMIIDVFQVNRFLYEISMKFQNSHVR